MQEEKNILPYLANTRGGGWCHRFVKGKGKTFAINYDIIWTQLPASIFLAADNV